MMSSKGIQNDGTKIAAQNDIVIAQHWVIEIVKYPHDLTAQWVY
jgi:hypothetical protein